MLEVFSTDVDNVLNRIPLNQLIIYKICEFDGRVILELCYDMHDDE